MGEVVEESNNIITLLRVEMESPAAEEQELVVSAPPMQLQDNSPYLSGKPLLLVEHPDVTTRRGGTHSLTPFFTPLGSPIRRAIQMTKFDPQDAWLPITESRNGNAFYAAFHTLCSGIGIQALVLPVSFTILGW